MLGMAPREITRKTGRSSPFTISAFHHFSILSGCPLVLCTWCHAHPQDLRLSVWQRGERARKELQLAQAARSEVRYLIQYSRVEVSVSVLLYFRLKRRPCASYAVSFGLDSPQSCIPTNCVRHFARIAPVAPVSLYHFRVSTGRGASKRASTGRPVVYSGGLGSRSGSKLHGTLVCDS